MSKRVEQKNSAGQKGDKFWWTRALKKESFASERRADVGSRLWSRAFFSLHDKWVSFSWRMPLSVRGRVPAARNWRFLSTLGVHTPWLFQDTPSPPPHSVFLSQRSPLLTWTQQVPRTHCKKQASKQTHKNTRLSAVMNDRVSLPGEKRRMRETRSF